MASPYRDSLEALKEQVTALDRQIEELEKTFTPIFWEEVGPSISIPPPKTTKGPLDEATPEEWMQTMAERQERLVSLQRVLNDFRRVEEWWQFPSSEPPPLRLLPEPVAVQMNRPFKAPSVGKKFFVKVLREFAPEVELQTMKPAGMGGVVEIDGVHFGLTYQGWSTSRSSEQEPINMVTARVPPGAAELKLKPQNIGDEILAKLRLRQDIVIGHHDFDGYFLIQGDKEAAREMLTLEVRDRLLQIARSDIPSLEVSRGIARLWWMYPLDRPTLELAIEALRLLREAHPTRNLRKD